MAKVCIGHVGCLVLVWLVLGFGVQPDGVLADIIYKYTDRDGVIHFTNVPTSPKSKQVPLPRSGSFPLPGKPAAPSGSNGQAAGSSAASASKGQEYERHIRAACVAHNLDHRLVKAVIRAESQFNPEAVSPKGAMGLMQLMPETSRLLGVGDPFDPSQNIDGGVRYLKDLMGRYQNNIALALAAYNAGPGAVERYGGIPPYDETLVYIQRVLRYYLAYLR